MPHYTLPRRRQRRFSVGAASEMLTQHCTGVALTPRGIIRDDIVDNLISGSRGN